VPTDDEALVDVELDAPTALVVVVASASVAAVGVVDEAAVRSGSSSPHADKTTPDTKATDVNGRMHRP
jgi:hypothetical protein